MIKCPNCKKEMKMVIEYFTVADDVNLDERGDKTVQDHGKVHGYPNFTACPHCAEKILAKRDSDDSLDDVLAKACKQWSQDERSV